MFSSSSVLLSVGRFPGLSNTCVAIPGPCVKTSTTPLQGADTPHFQAPRVALNVLYFCRSGPVSKEVARRFHCSCASCLRPSQETRRVLLDSPPYGQGKIKREAFARMRAFTVLGLLGQLAVAAVAQSASPAFEDGDFNVTQALLDQGIDAAKLPTATSETSRSAGNRCTAAVSSLRPSSSATVKRTRLV